MKQHVLMELIIAQLKDPAVALHAIHLFDGCIMSFFHARVILFSSFFSSPNCILVRDVSIEKKYVIMIIVQSLE